MHAEMDDRRDDFETSAEMRLPHQARKPYQSPTLQVHGKIEEHTLAASGTGADGGFYS
jgi:hypothetical protein